MCPVAQEFAVPPSRPYWKGYLKLALVSCPVALYPASTSSERVSFRQINKKTGNRLRQQLVDDVTREPVESHDKARGYEYDKNAYILVEDEEMDAIALESNHTLEIDTFVPREQIDERYLDGTYYMVPNDEVGQEACPRKLPREHRISASAKGQLRTSGHLIPAWLRSGRSGARRPPFEKFLTEK
jgi:hypothetical protein